MPLPKDNKGCGCLISHAVIDLEKERRKNLARLSAIESKLKSSKSQSVAIQLKGERKQIISLLRKTGENKAQMKQRFDHFVQKSGYVPPARKGIA